MKRLLVLMVCLVGSATVWAGSYTSVTDTSQDNTVQFFVPRLELTAQATLQQICDAGLLNYLQLRTKLDAEEAQRAFTDATPEDQAALCTILCNSGYTCPGFTCP